MITEREKERVEKSLKDWNEKFNEMNWTFEMLKTFYEKSKWRFWRKARMHGLLKDNKNLLERAREMWKKHDIDITMEKEHEFLSNHKQYMKYFEGKRKKIRRKRPHITLTNIEEIRDMEKI